MALNINPEPVLVLYKSDTCHFCTELTKMWDTPPNKDEDSIVTALKKVYPRLRFYILSVKDNTGIFDENSTPKDLIRYGKWYPMVLLIPGRLWDNAMSKLGPKNDVQLIDGVQIMNGKLENNNLVHMYQYNNKSPAQFAAWLKASLENEEFKKVQYGTLSSPISSNNIRSNIILPYNESLDNICSMRIIPRPK